MTATAPASGGPRIGVITFPGTLDDVDAARAVRYAGAEPVSLWHADADLRGVDAVVVPGGFSYGDYLRAGAIAAQAPVMRSVIDAARGGLPVLGICNGFQVLCEAGLLPGALVRNSGLKFVCRDQWLRVENTSSPWTTRYEPGAEILVPLKNAEGRYVADRSVLDELEGEGRVLFRYIGGGTADGPVPDTGNPNGALRDIAGICSADGRVAALMPHPEHAIDPLTGPTDDGLGIFLSVLDGLGVAA
ncbi:phosphoribosylformylglycinamidine synthase subunit PurQ [Nakamurella endophytica]|uniref:phosphoribosylformylglycinamidine synthase subunit PurQ n=1 Tax=Nakamurella endophytica TaxID=1748367 RepID=UPI00166DD7C3|nr:phosphoribosylformylglycinamidine synthase subunit PurQ [Nakamurella endophytica]